MRTYSIVKDNLKVSEYQGDAFDLVDEITLLLEDDKSASIAIMDVDADLLTSLVEVAKDQYKLMDLSKENTMDYFHAILKIIRWCHVEEIFSEYDFYAVILNLVTVSDVESHDHERQIYYALVDAIYDKNYNLFRSHLGYAMTMMVKGENYASLLGNLITNDVSNMNEAEKKINTITRFIYNNNLIAFIKQNPRILKYIRYNVLNKNTMETLLKYHPYVVAFMSVADLLEIESLLGKSWYRNMREDIQSFISIRLSEDSIEE